MLCMDLAVIMLKLDILSSPSMSANGIESGVWSLSLKDFSSLSMLPMDVDFRSFWHDDDEWFKIEFRLFQRYNLPKFFERGSIFADFMRPTCWFENAFRTN